MNHKPYTQPILEKYQDRKLGLNDLLRSAREYLKLYPDEKNKVFTKDQMVAFSVHSLAIKDPKLTVFASKILIKSSLNDDAPGVFISNNFGVKIVYINKDELTAEQVFSRTNEEDKEIFKIKERQIKAELEETKKVNQKRLAYLELLPKTADNQDRLANAKIREAFVVRT